MEEPTFTENSRQIFDLRYPRKGADGKPTETPVETIRRVADNVAIVNALYVGLEKYEADEDANTHMVAPLDEFPVRTARRQYYWLARNRGSMGPKVFPEFGEVIRLGIASAQAVAERYADMIGRWDFLPNSPTWTGAGTPLGQLAACFVLPIDDDLGRERSSIFETLRVAALIQQTGGGNGFSFGRLRPKDAIISTSMGRSSGPIGFLHIYNEAFGQIAQGGSRRGANMGILPVDHPDVRDFIKAKVEEGRIANFNLSVGITDEFMEAVRQDRDFQLRFDGEVYETVRARDLFGEIVENAWVMGDPGNLFLDRANLDNPVPTRYVLEATNPCGEQYLGPYENCCLGSINLRNFVEGHYLTGDASFNWRRFAETVKDATEFLDDVVDANQYVPSVPELEEAAQGGRRIGLGLMGLADAMVRLGICYGSEEGLAFASQVTEFARYHCMLTSIMRAKDRGPFEWIDDSIYDSNLMRKYGPGADVFRPLRPGHPLYDGSDSGITMRLWEPPKPLDDRYNETFDFGRPSIDWTLVVDGIKQWGIRNSCQFTFAPTGTISNVAALEGSGCEPFFALSYVRTVMQEGENLRLPYLSPSFKEALDLAGVSDEMQAQILEQVERNGGSCQGIDLVPKEIRNVFVVAADVKPEDHVYTQAALQCFVDNSISKTINMPNEATVEDVATAYRLAYDLGCKGITIYRQGSRQLEVLSTSKKTEETSDEYFDKVVEEFGQSLDDGITVWPIVKPLSLPDYASTSGLAARVYPVETFYGKVQVTITELDEFPGRPFDVRLQLGKAGNDTNAYVEAIGRMISLALRAGVPVKEVVKQLEGIGGQNVWGFGPTKVRSVADGVAKLLARRYLERPMQHPEMPQFTETVTASVVTYSQTTTPDGMVEAQQSSTVYVADPDTLCPYCHNATIVMEAGCRHCEPRLGGCGQYSGCD